MTTASYLPLCRKFIYSVTLFTLLSSTSQAEIYRYDKLNRLTQIIYPSGEVVHYYYDAGGNLLKVETSTLADVSQASCLLYAVHDEGKADSQFFTVDPSQNFAVQLLGSTYANYDMEALDIHPITDQIFAATGDDGISAGVLYTLNAETGEPYPIGETGFAAINGLSFTPDGILWGWAQNEGLIQIDIQTGEGTLILAYRGHVEDITWDNTGTLLYAVQNNQLLAYHTQTGQLETLGCRLPGGEVEALEILPDDRLLFAIHNDDTVSIHALEVNSCELVGANIQTVVEEMQLNDIEGIAWPTTACTAH